MARNQDGVAHPRGRPKKQISFLKIQQIAQIKRTRTKFNETKTAALERQRGNLLEQQNKSGKHLLQNFLKLSDVHLSISHPTIKMKN